MKTADKILIMFLFATAAFGLVACSSNSGEGYTGDDYFEITIDGETTTTILESIIISGNGEYNFIQSGEVEGVDFMLTTYSDLGKLASSDIDKVYRINPAGEPANLDLDITIHGEDREHIDGQRSKHIVKSIERCGDEVVVEGEFECEYRQSRGELYGKYRITVW